MISRNRYYSIERITKLYPNSNVKPSNSRKHKMSLLGKLFNCWKFILPVWCLTTNENVWNRVLFEKFGTLFFNLLEIVLYNSQIFIINFFWMIWKFYCKYKLQYNTFSFSNYFISLTNELIAQTLDTIKTPILARFLLYCLLAQNYRQKCQIT